MIWIVFAVTVWLIAGVLGLGVLAYERVIRLIEEMRVSPELLRRQISRMHRTEQALRAIEFEGVE